MNREVLMLRLERAFDGSPGERRAVARMAGDLHDSGKYASDEGHELDPDTVIEHLSDSPEEGPAARWNWWMGALETAYGGYTRFQVRRWEE